MPRNFCLSRNDALMTQNRCSMLSIAVIIGPLTSASVVINFKSRPLTVAWQGSGVGFGTGWIHAAPSSGRAEVLVLGLDPSQKLALKPSGRQAARQEQSCPSCGFWQLDLLSPGSRPWFA